MSQVTLFFSVGWMLTVAAHDPDGISHAWHAVKLWLASFRMFRDELLAGAVWEKWME